MSGLRVIEVYAQGQADNLGILLDDIIVSYNANNLQSPDDLALAIQDAKLQRLTAVEIMVKRNHELLTFAANLEPLGVQLANVAAQAISSEIGQVKIVNVQMPFSSMVLFMIKLAIASIPACIVLAILWSVIMAVLAGIGFYF